MRCMKLSWVVCKKKMLEKCVDMWSLGISEYMAQNRSAWRNVTTD